MKAKILALTLFLVILLAKLSTGADEPQEVEVGIYILNIGKFEVSTGSYTVDFYLSMKCRDACDPSNFEFMNGRATSIDKLIDEPNEKFYRIQASLAENIDLKKYPFDEHFLTIQLEDKRNKSDKLVYVPDKKSAGVDPSVVIVGWDLLGYEQEVAEHFYEPYEETYSRFIFKIHIRRILLAAIIKTFLPVIFIVIAGLLALLIHEQDKLWTRIGINTSSLIASVMFHLNVTSSIPPVGYLTFADKFMISTYSILLLSLFSTVMMMRHAKRKDDVTYNRIYLVALYCIPVLAVFLYGLVILI
ncbi:MAG: hypothetical protein N3F05_04235 [Candidatus Diapherotrites archaeon]|nr:hypothetical protein [Candidatus Diapherotrites archaeon]